MEFIFLFMVSLGGKASSNSDCVRIIGRVRLLGGVGWVYLC